MQMYDINARLLRVSEKKTSLDYFKKHQNAKIKFERGYQIVLTSFFSSLFLCGIQCDLLMMRGPQYYNYFPICLMCARILLSIIGLLRLNSD